MDRHRRWAPFLLISLWALWAGGGGPPPWRTSPPPAYRVDLNRASPEELALLPGLGPKRARRVVEARERGGPFTSTADLIRRVRGIGPVLARGILPFLEKQGRFSEGSL